MTLCIERTAKLKCYGYSLFARGRMNILWKLKW